MNILHRSLKAPFTSSATPEGETGIVGSFSLPGWVSPSASCTTSLSYVILFKELFSFSLPVTYRLISVLDQVAFVLESGCKGMAFSLNPQEFTEKSYAERLLFNTCLHFSWRFVRGHIVLFTRACGRAARCGAWDGRGGGHDGWA